MLKIAWRRLVPIVLTGPAEQGTNMAQIVFVISLLAVAGVALGMIVPAVAFYFWPQPNPGWKDYLRYGAVGPVAVLLSVCGFVAVVAIGEYSDPRGFDKVLELARSGFKFYFFVVGLTLTAVLPIAIVHAIWLAHGVARGGSLFNQAVGGMLALLAFLCIFELFEVQY